MEAIFSSDWIQQTPQFPIRQYYIANYNIYPNRLYLFYFISDISVHIKSLGFEELSHEFYMSSHIKSLDEIQLYCDTIIFEDKKNEIILQLNGEEEGFQSVFGMNIFYNDRSKVDKFIEKIKSFHIVNDFGKIYVIKKQEDNYYTKSIKVKTIDIDIGLNYGNEFISVHEKIISELDKKEGNGLILLHGEYGTGKSTYIKYLSSLVKDRKMIYIPTEIFTEIENPELVSILIENQNSIILIEDAESILESRESGNGRVSTLLDMSDGILGSLLNFHTIATFNTDLKNIDSALKRKGRLKVDWRFDKLSIENSDKLAEKLKIKDFKAIEPMSLADIYFMNDQIKAEEEDQRKIGF